MTHVISTINLKGGVAKTTTTVALAEALSSEFQKKVLVIDLDPQTNATVMLIGEQRWGKLNAKHRTLETLFRDAVEQGENFDLEQVLVKSVSDVGTATSIDLLPSSLDLIDLQDRLATVSAGKFFAVNPIDLLARAVRPILGEYDVVLIDCPPNLGIITLNGLRISDGFIIPTIPDFLSTYGIPQIAKRVGDFAKAIGQSIDPLGIVLTKYQSNSPVHKNTINLLKANESIPLFETLIPQASQISSAAEYEKTKRTFRQKYGYGGLAERYLSLANEIINKIEG